VGLGFSPRNWSFCRLFFPMLGDFGLPSPDSWCITRIFLVAVLEGWVTQSPISQ
jgi:hypothetical protein